MAVHDAEAILDVKTDFTSSAHAIICATQAVGQLLRTSDAYITRAEFILRAAWAKWSNGLFSVPALRAIVFRCAFGTFQVQL